MSDLTNIILNGVSYDLNNSEGLTDETKQALLQLASKVAYIDDDGQDYYQDLYDALYPQNVTSISCVYTQSGTVYDTDSLNSLKSDLVVTAQFSDGTTHTITTYSLSGSLIVGTSTITVSYNGKTTTFTVAVTLTPLYAFPDRVVTETDYTLETDKSGHIKINIINDISYSGDTIGYGVNIYGGKIGALNDPNINIKNQPKTFTIPSNTPCIFALTNIDNPELNEVQANLYKANDTESAGSTFAISTTSQDASSTPTTSSALDIYTPFLFIKVSNHILPSGYTLECDLSLTVDGTRYF